MTNPSFPWHQQQNLEWQPLSIGQDHAIRMDNPAMFPISTKLFGQRRNCTWCGCMSLVWHTLGMFLPHLNGIRTRIQRMPANMWTFLVLVRMCPCQRIC